MRIELSLADGVFHAQGIKPTALDAEEIWSMTSRLLLVPAVVTAALASGCGGAPAQMPASASLAPADAVAYARLVTDSDSAQWKQAEQILERIPGVRDTVVGGLGQALADEALDWEEDIAPAVGDEVVVVVTADMKPIVLLQPDSQEKLDALLAKSDEDAVRGEVGGRTALAETNEDLAAYEAALEQGTIENEKSFVDGLAALLDDSLALVWVDVAVLTDQLSPLAQEATQGELDLGIDWLSAAVAAEDDGMLVAVGARSPGTGGTHYEPTLFRSVPADAVAAFSFGGTQETLDRLQGQLNVDELSRTIEGLTGVSLDGIVDALSGEGVLFVRPAEPAPGVTLALAPPDPAKTWETVDRLARRLATGAQAEVSTTIEHGIEVSQVEVEGVTLRYARLDAETIVVTVDPDALALLAGDGPKLYDSEGFLRAAADVGLEDRTKGFLYVDVDGMLPMLESLAGESVPPDVREGFEAVDSIVFQTSGEGDTSVVSGFVRVP